MTARRAGGPSGRTWALQTPSIRVTCIPCEPVYPAIGGLRALASHTPTRRRFLAYGLDAATGATISRDVLAAPPNAVCTLAAQQEVGPFYIPDELLRQDIREGQPGGRGREGSREGADGPPDGPPPEGAGAPPNLPPGSGVGPPPGAMQPTDTQTFLRGVQITNPTGIATFSTIAPGCYQGRTNHIHFRVRLGAHSGQRTYPGGHLAHTGQVFLRETLVAPLMTNEPNRSHHLARFPLDQDHVYQRKGGNQHFTSDRRPSTR